jgi:hypothetical protein
MRMGPGGDPVYVLMLDFDSKTIPAQDDVDDFLEKEKIILGTIESNFPGWMDKQFQTPIIRKLFLNIRDF